MHTEVMSVLVYYTTFQSKSGKGGGGEECEGQGRYSKVNGVSKADVSII